MSWIKLRDIRFGRPSAYRLPEKIGETITLMSDKKALTARLRYQKETRNRFFRVEETSKPGWYDVTRVK